MDKQTQSFWIRFESLFKVVLNLIRVRFMAQIRIHVAFCQHSVRSFYDASRDMLLRGWDKFEPDQSSLTSEGSEIVDRGWRRNIRTHRRRKEKKIRIQACWTFHQCVTCSSILSHYSLYELSFPNFKPCQNVCSLILKLDIEGRFIKIFRIRFAA